MSRRPHVVEEAILLIPEVEIKCLPSYIFALVAGLPLLLREILSLKRVGIKSVTIMVSPAVRPELEYQLSQVTDSDLNINILSNWQDLWEQAEHGNKSNPRLVVMADTLIDTRLLAKFMLTRSF